MITYLFETAHPYYYVVCISQTKRFLLPQNYLLVDENRSWDEISIISQMHVDLILRVCTQKVKFYSRNLNATSSKTDKTDQDV